MAGPQSFAGAAVGTEQVEPRLLRRNLQVEHDLLAAAEAYHAAEDLRWFFAYSHARITKQINENILLFQRPNALLRLNMHFAEAFLRAVGGQGHEFWKNAFRICKGLQENRSALVPEAEVCAGQMARVHIQVDLSAALREVGCIPAGDYANMLIFVNRGSLAAQVRLRDRGFGALEAIFVAILAPLVDLDVKTWRNAAYESFCRARVPDPDDTFLP